MVIIFPGKKKTRGLHGIRLEIFIWILINKIHTQIHGRIFTKVPFFVQN